MWECLHTKGFGSNYSNRIRALDVDDSLKVGIVCSQIRTRLQSISIMNHFGSINNRFYSWLWLMVSIGAITLRASYLSTQQQQQKLIVKSVAIPMPGKVFKANRSCETDAWTTAFFRDREETSVNSADELPSADDSSDAASKNRSSASTVTRAPVATEAGLRHCKRHQVAIGNWVTAEMKRPPYVTPTLHLRCYPNEVYRKQPWRTYKWVPNDAAAGICKFSDYNPDDFCKLLPRGTMSIVGDSLSWEHYRSMIQAHGRATHQNFQHQSRELHTNILHSICSEGEATSVVYRRDDLLRNLTASLQQHFPVVLVLNRGAHYVPDDELLTDIRRNIEEVRAWLRRCDAYRIKCHFFWRTTVPGHPGCGNFTTPVNDIKTMEAWIANKTMYNKNSYHWPDFQHQNQLVVSEFIAANLSSFQVLDAYYLNVLRPDEHRAHQGDCLHNCYPGKMDVYNQLLLHYLSMQRRDNDVKRLVAVATDCYWPVHPNTVYDWAATDAARNIREEAQRKERYKQGQKYQPLAL